ncbi:lipase family protein [Apibacter raozihei]|uniref:lipase family protein n=1 Tax=Apibacter raozihei TaxID=2500547 RepID=UPI000FE40604|nr:lipase family protein [Apibacter raozihei]
MKKFTLFAFICILSTFTSCTDDDIYIHTSQQNIKSINRLSYDDLSQMELFFKSSISAYNSIPGINLDFSNFNLAKQKETLTNKGLHLDSLYVSVYKINYKEQHPGRKGTFINNSGILLLPSKSILSDGKSCKLVIIAPGAYTGKNEAASAIYQDKELLNNQVFENKLTNFFNNLLAVEGFAVLIPDYPGFGDSYGECSIPVLEAQPMANSLINLTKTAQRVISKLNYSQKNGVILSGYSLGGYTSGLAGKKNETDRNELNVDLLLVGGALTSLPYLADEVKKDHQTMEHLIFPWAVMAYQHNGYPNLKLDNVILKDQQPNINEYLLSGKYSALDIITNNLFPVNSSDFYTSEFRSSESSNSDYAYLKQILTENSFSPWKNKTKFQMIHAINDHTAYYEPAKRFADETNQMGGNVTFETTIGAHSEGALFFYQRLLENSIELNK